jgi:hypothetical protein
MRRRTQRRSDERASTLSTRTGEDPGTVSNQAMARAVGAGRVMGDTLGIDLADVHVTTGADLSAIGASAVTSGAEVSFSEDRPDPRTVAHELVHVAQNEVGGPTTTRPVSDPDSAAEREARVLAGPVAAGRSVHVRVRPHAAVQRELLDTLLKIVAQVGHAIQQARVYSIIDRGLAATVDPARGTFDFTNLLHNSAEWITHNNCSVVVLTPIHDSATRNPPEIGYFDPTVEWPRSGGTYPLDSAVVDDPHIRYEDPGDIGGMSPGGAELSIVDPARQSDSMLQDTIIHEVQHDADQTWPGQRWADPAGSAFNDYQSEFRAYWLGSGEGSPSDQFASSADPATNGQEVEFTDPASGDTTSVATAFGNLRQEEIFWHLVDTGYEYVAQNYVQVPAFKKMVDEMTSPAGGNLVNSVRIQELSERLDNCDPAMPASDAAVVAMFAAADSLDALDRDYLRDEGLAFAFWEQAAARLSVEIRDMLHNTVWFGTRQPWGDFVVPEGDTSFA